MPTFEQVWREVRTEFPLVPPLLMRNWAQEGLDRACERHGFAFLRSENALITTAARSLTATVTLGSQTVTSPGLFLAADAGRQFRIGTIGTGNAATVGLPIYTITQVIDPNTIIIDLPFSRDSATGTAQIIDIYTTMPADFRRFLVIYDTYFLRTIPFWLNEDQIAIADPGRVFTDTGPRYLIARKYSSYPPTAGRVQYEYWPAPTSARSYPYLYIASPPRMNDTDVLPGVLATRGDALKAYCRYRATLYPGTTDQKNSGYAPSAAPFWKAEWEAEVNQLTLSDDNEYPQQLMTIHWMRRFGAIAPTATLLRQTDATINDYF